MYGSLKNGEQNSNATFDSSMERNPFTNLTDSGHSPPIFSFLTSCFLLPWSTSFLQGELFQERPHPYTLQAA